jgi:hypothetical protein
MTPLFSQAVRVRKFLVSTSPDTLKYNIHILEKQAIIILIFNKLIVDNLLRLDKPSTDQLY